MNRLILTLALVLLAYPVVGASEVRYGVEVAAGDATALEEIRVELQKNIAVGGATPADVARWRYDWAYLNWRMGQILREADRKRSKRLLKEAEAQLDLLLEANPENAEAHALRGSVIGERIDGGFSGALLGGRSSKAHKKAVELAPDNPRVQLLQGIGHYYTPKTFGGGVEIAAEELRRAVELFDGEPVDGEWPNWGRIDALGWLGKILVERGEAEEARELFDRALTLEPSSVWVQRLMGEL